MSAGAKRYDDRGKPWLALLVLLLTVAGWFFAVDQTYTMPKESYFKALWYAVLATPTNIGLWLPPVLAFLFGMTIFIIVNQYMQTGFGGGAFISRLRGPRMVSQSELKDTTKEWFEKQLSIAGIPIPKKLENQHLQVTGSTGSGKSQAIAEYIQSAHARGDRIICIDPNGGFMQHFWKDGDVILNPFDARGKSWSIFNEIRTPYDVEQYAVSMIPKSPSTEQEQWNSMARTIVSEVMLKLAQLGKNNTDALVYWLTTATNNELQQMLSDTSAAGMFHGADETLGSVRTVLTRYITPHKYLSGNDGESFSIRNWLDSGTGNLWVTWREDMLPALKPLISCWVDTICASSLSTDVDNTRPIHFIVDELDSLEKLNYLGSAATKGRKHEFKILTGIQSYAQLDETNGKNDAMTLRNSLRNTLSLGISEGDTYTAEEISKGLGQHEVVRERVSTGQNGPTKGIETVSERLVLPSEIHTLPDLTGYLKLAGNMPIAKVKMTYKKRPTVIEPLVLVGGMWTTPIAEQRDRLRRSSAPDDAVV